MNWWRLAFLSALVIVLAMSGLLWLRSRPPKHPPSPAACPPVADSFTLPSAQLDTPVLLGATGPVKLLLDGAPQSLTDIALLPPGKHTLRAEANGFTPLTIDFRLDAFHPGLFEVEPSAQHLSLVYLGADCHGCSTPATMETLPLEPASASFDELETKAAQALERGDWVKAAVVLRQVQRREREQRRYQRLAENVLQSSGAHAEARAQALGIEGSPQLTQLLDRYDESVRREAIREHRHYLDRWNALTELYARLLPLEADAPHLLDEASKKLAAHSSEFTLANKEGSAEAERETTDAAERELTELVKKLRAFKPFDCELQAKVSAAL